MCSSKSECMFAIAIVLLGVENLVKSPQKEPAQNKLCEGKWIVCLDLRLNVFRRRNASA